jgi:hypothetical protein
MKRATPCTKSLLATRVESRLESINDARWIPAADQMAKPEQRRRSWNIPNRPSANRIVLPMSPAKSVPYVCERTLKSTRPISAISHRPYPIANINFQCPLRNSHLSRYWQPVMDLLRIFMGYWVWPMAYGLCEKGTRTRKFLCLFSAGVSLVQRFRSRVTHQLLDKKRGLAIGFTG